MSVEGAREALPHHGDLDRLISEALVEAQHSGESYSYALAIETGEPLLFVGDDFSHTDVRSVL